MAPPPSGLTRRRRARFDSTPSGPRFPASRDRLPSRLPEALQLESSEVDDSPLTESESVCRTS